eukprot:Em0005g559a
METAMKLHGDQTLVSMKAPLTGPFWSGKPAYLVCQLNNGTSCPKAIGPDTTLNFVCNIEEQQLGFTKRLLPNRTCTNSERIFLLQPKYGGCNPSSSSQHAPPHTPNMSVVPSCTKIAVQWSVSSMSLEEPTTVIVSVKTGTIVSQTNSISTTMSTSSMTFNNLVSDSLYTITVEGSNCAGRSSATIDMWTLPSPPQNIHAYHVVSTPSTVHLQETWTPVGGNNKLTYVMRVSSKDDLILNQVPVSSDHCDTTMCQFTIDFNATDTSVFFISIATISESRIGPHSDEVKSVLEVGTNKKMKGDLLELNTNTTYGSPTVQELKDLTVLEGVVPPLICGHYPVHPRIFMPIMWSLPQVLYTCKCHLQVGNNKLTYVMRVSSKDDLILNQVPVSSDHCDTTMCQFTIDFNATDTSVFFISIATISDSRIGPHSDEVKSVLVPTLCTVDEHVNPRIALRNLGILTLTRKGIA